MKKIIFVVLLALSINSFSFAKEVDQKIDVGIGPKTSSAYLKEITPLLISNISTVPIRKIFQVLVILDDYNGVKLKNNQDILRINDEVKSKFEKKFSQCPVKVTSTVDNQIVNINSIFKNGSDYLDKFEFDVAKKTYEYNNQFEYEDIYFERKKIAGALKINGINNANGYTFSNEKDWAKFIESINKTKLESRVILNQSGEEVGISYIYESNVDGFSNQIHVYTENRYIDFYWTEFTK